MTGKTNFETIVGKYALWRCDRCGMEKEYQIGEFTTSAGELMPTCGWACRKCGMRGQMKIQRVIKK